MAIRLSRPFVSRPPPPPSFPCQSASRELRSCGYATGGDPEDDPVVVDVVSILTHQRCRSRWGFLKSLYGPSGFTAAQAAHITLRLRNNPRLALRFFRWSEAASLCRHDLPSYAAVAHVLARGRLRSAAQSLIRSAILHASGEGDGGEDAPIEVLAAFSRSYRAFDSAPLVFDLLVRACLQARRVDQALEIVRKLRRRGLFPAVGSCNELIRAVSKGRGAEAGFCIYKELFDPGDDGVGAPSKARTFSILMASLCEEGRVQEAKALWTEMAAKGIKPDATAYNTFIGGFCRTGEMKRAEEVFRGMVLEGVVPTATSYDRLISGYSCAGDLSNALLLFDEMRRKGFTPEASTVGELIEGLCLQSRVAEGVGVLRGEMGRGGFFPSRGMFISLIKGFCRHGQVEEGLQLQKEMAGKGFEPDCEVYGAFVEGYMGRGDVGTAERLKDETFKLGLKDGVKHGAVEDELLSRVL